jgi:hypothetical protein
MFVYSLAFTQEQYIVLSNNDTLFVEIKMDNLENSLKQVEFIYDNNIYKLKADSVKCYNRGDVKIQRYNKIKDSVLIYEFRYLIEDNDKYQLYSFLNNNEIQYILSNKIDKKEYLLNKKNWNRLLPRILSDKKNIKEILDENFCMEELGSLINYAASNESTFISNNNKLQSQFLNNKVPTKLQQQNFLNNKSYSLIHYKFKKFVFGFSYKSDTATYLYGDNRPKSYENNFNWLHYHIGINLGTQYLIQPFLDYVVPLGIGFGMENELGILSEKYRIGYIYNYTYTPYVNGGNASNKDFGITAKAFIGNYMYVKIEYLWNRFRYNQYNFQSEECSNIRDEVSGIVQGDRYMWALRVTESKANYFNFFIGLNAKDNKTYNSIFNNFEIGYGYIPLNPVFNQQNISNLNTNNDFSEFNGFMHCISIRLGIYSYFE